MLYGLAQNWLWNVSSYSLRKRKRTGHSFILISPLSYEISDNPPSPTALAFILMCPGGRHNITHSWRETLTIVKASALVYSCIMRIKQPIMSKISMSYFPQIWLFCAGNSSLEYSLYSGWVLCSTYTNAEFLKDVWVWCLFKSLFPTYSCLFQFTKQQVFGFSAAI